MAACARQPHPQLARCCLRLKPRVRLFLLVFNASLWVSGPSIPGSGKTCSSGLLLIDWQARYEGPKKRHLPSPSQIEQCVEWHVGESRNSDLITGLPLRRGKSGDEGFEVWLTRPRSVWKGGGGGIHHTSAIHAHPQLRGGPNLGHKRPIPAIVLGMTALDTMDSFSRQSDCRNGNQLAQAG